MKKERKIKFRFSLIFFCKFLLCATEKKKKKKYLPTVGIKSNHNPINYHSFLI